MPHNFIAESNRTYQHQKQKEVEAWARIRENVFNIILNKEELGDMPCCLCGARNAIFRCMDCNASAIFCESCVITVHMTAKLHLIEKWMVSNYTSFAWRMEANVKVLYHSFVSHLLTTFLR